MMIIAALLTDLARQKAARTFLRRHCGPLGLGHRSPLEVRVRVCRRPMGEGDDDAHTTRSVSHRTTYNISLGTVSKSNNVSKLWKSISSS